MLEDTDSLDKSTAIHGESALMVSSFQI